MGKINRRNFIASSAASMFGYSVMVSAPNSAKALEPTDERSRKLAAIGDSKNSPFADNEKLLKKVGIDCDVLVAGGGLAGISAALSAARNGKKVVLIKDNAFQI